jgi:hypothetical protein
MSPDWLGALRRYVMVAALGHLGWELAHLPLYGIWREGSGRAIAVAVLHCTAGDLVIGVTALVLALVLVGGRQWPAGEGFLHVAAAAIVIGVAYTVYSEWLNTTIRRTWTYSPLMPVLPGIGIGLSPVAQWVVVPSAALFGAWHRGPPR